MPHGRPNLRSRLHSCHAQEGGPRSPQRTCGGKWTKKEILPRRLVIIPRYCIYCLIILSGTRCVLFEVQIGTLFLYLRIVTLLFREGLSRRPLTVQIRFRSQDSPYEIYGGHSATVTGFSPSTSVLPLSILIHQCSIYIFILILCSRSILV